MSKDEEKINDEKREDNLDENNNNSPTINNTPTKEEKLEYSKMIGNYILFDQIGMGTFSKVTRAVHILTEQIVAVKILEKEKIEDNIDVERIIREIEILKNISHPNIIKLIEIKDTPKYCYIVTEYCNGGSLSNCLEKYQEKNNKAFPEEVVQYLMYQIVDAIKYLHKNEILHRDLKLDNILINYDNDNDRKNSNIMKGKIKIF